MARLDLDYWPDGDKAVVWPPGDGRSEPSGDSDVAGIGSTWLTLPYTDEDTREVCMFGGLSFMVGERRAVAAGRDGDLLVRTDPARYDELLRRGGTPAYMGRDRPMGPGWLTVPGQQLQHDQELAYWIEVGIDPRSASN